MSVSYSLLKVVLIKDNIIFYLHRFRGINEYKIRRYNMNLDALLYVIKDFLCLMLIVFKDDLKFILWFSYFRMMVTVLQLIVILLVYGLLTH